MEEQWKEEEKHRVELEVLKEAGTEEEELQFAEIRSPFLYLGRVPEMIGPWSGRSETSTTSPPSSSLPSP